MPYLHFSFVFVLLFFSDDTRRAVYFLPIWLLATALMYLKIKRKKEQSNQENLNKETALTDK